MTAQQPQTISININQVIVAFIASMAIICAFIAFMTNTIVNSKVNAIDTVNNPVTSTAAPQTNTAGGLCTAPEATEGDEGDAAAVGSLVSSSLKGYKTLPFNVTYNQSNTSNTSTTNTSTTTDSRFSGNSFALSNSQSWSWNNGNSSSTSTTTTTNTDNSNNSTNTNIQAWDNNNNNGNSSSNTSTTNNTNNTSTNTTTNTNVITDNSNNSTNTLVDIL